MDRLTLKILLPSGKAFKYIKMLDFSKCLKTEEMVIYDHTVFQYINYTETLFAISLKSSDR